MSGKEWRSRGLVSRLRIVSRSLTDSWNSSAALVLLFLSLSSPCSLLSNQLHSTPQTWEVYLQLESLDGQRDTRLRSLLGLWSILELSSPHQVSLAWSPAQRRPSSQQWALLSSSLIYLLTREWDVRTLLFWLGLLLLLSGPLEDETKTITLILVTHSIKVRDKLGQKSLVLSSQIIGARKVLGWL